MHQAPPVGYTPPCTKCGKALELKDIGTDYIFDDWTGVTSFYEDFPYLCGSCKQTEKE